MTMPFPAPGIVFGIPLAAAMLPGGTAGAQEYTLRMQTIFAQETPSGRLVTRQRKA